MASIDTYTTKTGKTKYRVRIYHKGRKSETAVFPTLAQARKYGTMIEGDIIAGRHFPVKSTHTLAELLDRYVTDVMPKKAPETARSQMPVIRYWRERLGQMLLADIEPRHIIACRDEIASVDKPATVVKYLMTLSHAFTVAMKDYFWVQDNPCRLIRRPSLPPGRIRYLSDEERAVLLAQCRVSKNRYLYPLVTMALYTGLRRGSLFALTIHNTDTEAGIISLPTTKNTRPLTLPLVGEALCIARELVATSKDGYVFPRGAGYPWCHYRTSWEHALKRARLEDTCFHSLRHCTGSYLVQAGVPLHIVSQILAHTRITTTQIYAHLHIDQMKDALTLLSQRLSSYFRS